MKKILFIDRDGTIIKEPLVTEQVDSYELLEFLPNAISSLKQIVKENDFLLVMVTNQDGLGTDSYPENSFWGPHNLMLNILENEGVVFHDVLIDRTFPQDNSINRKPEIGLVKKYMTNDYDLKNSFVIGDRESDMQFSRNLGSKGIFIGNKNKLEKSNEVEVVTESWTDILDFIRVNERKSSCIRKTSETNIDIRLNIDGSGFSEIKTGISFFDHMLEQISKHASFDLFINAEGDLHIDNHHTIEDVAITLGLAFKEALGKKAGIQRYGFCLPMDDSIMITALDFGGRSWLQWNIECESKSVAGIELTMFKHFFKSFSDSANCNLYVNAKGDDSHHLIEGIFKSFAKTLKNAVKKENGNFELPSTKGTL